MVSSCCPVFVGKDLEKVVNELIEKFDLKVINQFKNAPFEYYVLNDASGNRLDVMHYPKADKSGLFGMRVNVDDFDAMVDFLVKDQGYEFSRAPIETPDEKHCLLEHPSKADAVRYIVSYYKKD